MFKLAVCCVLRRARYYVRDPSKGAAPGVVKDSADAAITGKLELLKVGWLATELVTCLESCMELHVLVVPQPAICELVDAVEPGSKSLLTLYQVWCHCLLSQEHSVAAAGCPPAPPSCPGSAHHAQ
jgi:hypothetical protein